jgi:hypothetical protein
LASLDWIRRYCCAGNNWAEDKEKKKDVAESQLGNSADLHVEIRTSVALENQRKIEAKIRRVIREKRQL